MLERSKAMKYEENERVKLLRSQQLYTDVIATRQIQMQEKIEQKRQNEAEERKWHQQSMQALQKAAQKEEQDKTLRKQKQIENAIMMERQLLESKTKVKLIKMQRMNEEKAVVKKIEDEFVKGQQAMIEAKKRARQKSKKEMEQLTIDLKTKKQLEHDLEVADEKKRQKEIEKSAFVAKARAELERKHFNERQAARKLLSDKASHELKLRSEREVELFIREQKAIEMKDRKRKKQELQKRLEMEHAIDQSRKEQIAEKEIKRIEDAKNDAIWVNEYHQKCQKELENEKAKEAEKIKQNVEFRRIQEEQVAETRRQQKLLKEKELEDAKKIKTSLKEEDDVFLQFAREEMRRFENLGKKTDLLQKVVAT